ncbi:protein DEHYDRATION-INDUCED 19 homolog 7-like [Olea europaea var. sylvestris]|uniref:protein DEHYDRATION-INDUCED 19 homolog 7-like n=1 Tax=Olea europaea var. sylvestris TaxID=158386 RepID=UPI000C1D3EBA|nr:protein DEHYDRATION-INDUCED 19 homolog 7-like [Olea europaea var. sylvestris]
MDSDLWARLSNSSSYRRYQSRSDSYRGEEYEGEEELRPEFLCPFCTDEFDIVGLCCHIDDEHAIEAKNGVCPVCAKRVGTGLVSHITGQHGSLLKVQRRRRIRRGGSNSALSILRKELREGNLQTLFRGSSYLSSNAEPDSLLSSFIYSPPVVDEPPEVQPLSSTRAFSIPKSTGEDLVESNRNVQHLALSDKDQEEKAQKCEFVQGLLLSTFLDNL